MGTSRSVAQLAGKFAQWNAGLTTSTRDGVNKGALLVTTSVRAELRRVAPSGRLRGVGKNGARVSAAYKSAQSVTNPAALVFMRGPAHLIESDTKAHPISVKRRRRAGTAKKGLATPYGVFASVQHPGTKGKHPWEKGVRRARPLILPTVERETFAAMAKAFR